MYIKILYITVNSTIYRCICFIYFGVRNYYLLKENLCNYYIIVKFNYEKIFNVFSSNRLYIRLYKLLSFYCISIFIFNENQLIRMISHVIDLLIVDSFVDSGNP